MEYSQLHVLQKMPRTHKIPAFPESIPATLTSEANLASSFVVILAARWSDRATFAP